MNVKTRAALAALDRRALAAHRNDAVEREFFDGAIRIVSWQDGKRAGHSWTRYSLIVGKTVETVGAFSAREAVGYARAMRRFVLARDGVARSVRPEAANRRMFTPNSSPGSAQKGAPNGETEA